ncbi:mannitol dehydrogenase family protein [Gordonia sp. NB41Y]|uniref:mannitol dehydrogenase family protein n=1 Tax=Gordonia sp. NB41Y TaxID=875808 RepID=UPI00128EF135|nr:mannitol dehydrogenase family protein [Gordonia sp. NB41Y]WLP92863.1 mannitol dehydrogenase family protein [Gordonia sp. NB41Y]
MANHRRLSRTTVPENTLLTPTVPETTGIVHLGLGNFHRAHQAVYTALALAHEPGPWGILGVANRSHTVTDAMALQDELYSVVQISPAGSTVTVPGVHTGTLVASDAPEEVVAALAAPTTRIVTVTVTENGYHLDPDTGGLDLTAPEIVGDLAEDVAPGTTVGLIARALIRRAQTHRAPVTVLSCDNLVSNGRQTEQVVRDFLRAVQAHETLAWMDEGAVTFPNSMVDRIVPASADGYNDEASAQLGVRDTIAVPAEPFSMWVVEDVFAAGRPAWEHAGVRFTHDVEPYELMKVRLLNGTHSLIAYLGALSGAATIPESVGRPLIAAAARSVLRHEYLPTVPVPADVDIDKYIRQLFSRWSNTALGHRTSQVGSDGSVKLAQRIPEPALVALKSGRMPEYLALTVAAYLCAIAPPPGFEPGPHARAMTDPARERLVAMAQCATSTLDFVREVSISGGILPTSMAAHDDFIGRIAQYIDLIVNQGVVVALNTAAESETTPTR